MANLDIITDRNWNTVAEDMITQAFWPTLYLPVPDFDLWPVNIFEADSRFKGTLDFGMATSTSEFPLICYMCTGIGNPEIYTCQTMSTLLTVTVKIAFQGPADIDESTIKATRTGMGYWSKLVECISRQPYNPLGGGAFAYTDSTLVGGRGTGGILYNVFPVKIGDPFILKSLDETEELNRFAADVWTITGDITLNVISN